MNEFNRNNLMIRKLEERESKIGLDKIIDPISKPPKISSAKLSQLERVAESIKESKKNNSHIILAFGAHLVKNGLSRLVIEMIKKNYITHILGSGAVVIHDWELSYLGRTAEDVQNYVKQGQFGLWQETGEYINKAIKFGARNGLGHGQTIGKMIYEERIKKEIIPHKFKDKSILAEAYKLNVPVSICLGIGYDITQCHPECDGAALGETSYRDFLSFAETMKNFEGGTFVSIGSAIMAPMVFEKALSMAKNVAIQQNRILENYKIFVNDIQPSNWNWLKGEPPIDSPDYYLRFFKTFSRIGGTSEYVELDNRSFLQNLYALIK